MHNFEKVVLLQVENIFTINILGRSVVCLFIAGNITGGSIA